MKHNSTHGVKEDPAPKRAAELADVLTRLTAAMTRAGDSHKYHALMIEADLAIVRFSAGGAGTQGDKA